MQPIPRRVRPIQIAYGLIGCFFLIERLLRQGAAARSFEAGQEDQGSTRAIGAAFGRAIVALLLAPLLNRWRIGTVPGERLAWSGIVMMLAGLGLRVWASRALGAYYTRTLRTAEQQHIITQGPYRRIRHPGYLGVIALWLGAGLASANGLVALTISVPLLRAYEHRMRAEESMLAATFPDDYPAYTRRTWRLIPFLY